MKAKEIVFVLGMHRSGTSLISELIHAMGYEVPGSELEKIERVNARGFWESQQVVAINEHLLAGAGASWYQVGFTCNPLGNRSPEVGRTVSDMRSFLDANLEQRDRLVIKDPRLCHLLPVWLAAIDRTRVNVKIVWVSRNPLSVARSLQARDGFCRLTGLLLWLEAFLAGMKAAAKVPCLLVDYDRVLVTADTRDCLGAFIGSTLAQQEWSSIVDASLAHHVPEETVSSPLAQLAIECHASIESGAEVSPEFLRKVSAFRRRYSAMRARLGDFLAGLAETNAALVESKRLAMHVGALHSKALGVIAGQNKALAELGALREQLARHKQVLLDREAQIEATASHVAKCEARVRELDLILETRMHELQHAGALVSQAQAGSEQFDRQGLALQESRDRVAQLEILVAERDADIGRNAAYIDKCHRRIDELQSSMAEFEALRARLAVVESTLTQREADVAHNAEYIAACHARIAELDAAMGEFQALRTRLSEAEAKLAGSHDDPARGAANTTSLEERHHDVLEAASPVQPSPAPSTRP